MELLYLLYVGYLLLSACKRDIFEGELNSTFISNSKKTLFKHFSMGFLSAILNPKNSIFYFTMFSISIQNDTSFAIQSFYAIWMFLAVLFWDIFIVYLVSHKNSKKFMQKYSNMIEKISGIILIFIAVIIGVNLIY